MTTTVRRFIDRARTAPLWQQAVVVFLSAALITALFSAAAMAQGPKVTPLKEMARGSGNAKVTVTEYGSVTCTHCASWYTTNWTKFERDYIKTGKVRFVYREVATNPSNMAFGVYMLGHCAAAKPNWIGMKGGTRAYFTVIDGFFAAQSKVYETGEVEPVLKSLAQKTGLNNAELESCLNNEALFKSIATRMEANMDKDNVNSTPTFFVNGKRVNSDYASIEAAIKAASK
ncbi:MAG: thioredoxin domain-containing protein [Asticcacaulis sp.]